MIKTAISLSEFIYAEMDSLARRLKIPRSRLFALAAEEFLQRHKREVLIEKINKAVSDQYSNEDKKLLQASKRKFSQLVKGQW